jgi:hypothetical protein
MAQRGKAMRQVLIRTGLRGIIILIGILLICTILQFVTYLRGPEFVDIMMENMSFTDAAGEEQTKKALYRELGLDHWFIPDLWPFDNQSLWDKAEPASD